MASETRSHEQDGATTIPLSRVIAFFAAGLSLLVAAAPPIGLFLNAYVQEGARALIENRVVSAQVTEMIADAPETWMHQHLKLLEKLERTDHQAEGQQTRQIIGPIGEVLAARSVAADDGIAWPRLRRSDAIFDQGEVVGSVVLVRSMRAQALSAGWVALLSLLAGVACFTVLRVIPMRSLQRATRRAAWLASHDPLTGLANRSLFSEKLEDALARARRDGSTVAVLCLDLDHFKEVNDTLGHAAGDQLLRQVAERLLSNMRATDSLARLGGDEFAIVQTQAHQPCDAESLASRLSALIAEPFQLDGHQVVIGGSLGIALTAAGVADGARLMQEADLAMYQAKNDGRGGFQFYDEGMNQRLYERKAMEADLRTALAERQFTLAFQPQVRMGSAQPPYVITGAEALLRWTHPVKGNIPPDQFIPLAEQTNLILPIGDWVLLEACRQAVTWPSTLSVAVNVSTVQFRNPAFFSTVERALAESGLPASRLELEITESVMLADTAESVAIMEKLRSLGIRLAMDDFGTGYSSLGYLRKFKFDKIKIDKSFVRHLGEGGESEAIVRAVVGMSRAMGVQSNAEGVETEEQSLMLRGEGCTEMQGYLYGRPMTSEDFLALAEKDGTWPAAA